MATQIRLITAVGSTDLLDLSDKSIYLDLDFNGRETRLRILCDGTIFKEIETKQGIKEVELKEVSNDN